MSIKSVGVLAAISFLAVPGMALAGSFAVATQNVHVRAGPDVGYPSLDVARAGDDIYVYGCLRYEPWCDVDYDGLRGWISSHYLAFYDGGYRYVGQQAVYRMRAPVITFSISSYWDRHYRGRPFYRERSRWENFYRGRPGPTVRRVEPAPEIAPQRLERRRGERHDWRNRDRRNFWNRDNRR